MTIQSVIFNYNLPNQTDALHQKLQQDGFSATDILVVDNGSDKALPASSTNLQLPFNIRFSGQANIALQLLMQYRPTTHYVLITTSARLSAYINYHQRINTIVQDIPYHQFGCVMASLVGGDVNIISPEQSHAFLKEQHANYRPTFTAQPILTVVSHALLMRCLEFQGAYFNLALKRGHGIDRELQYLAQRHSLCTLISQDLWVHWQTNQVHKLGKADESAQRYHTYAQLEMEQAFTQRYGRHWQQRFLQQFEESYPGSILTTSRNQRHHGHLRYWWYQLKAYYLDIQEKFAHCKKEKP